MSKRKYIRKMLRAEAESIGAKASRFIRYEFDRYQTKKYGRKIRRANQCKGTHRRITWRARMLPVLSI